MKDQKLKGFLGLAKRAGRVTVGTEAVREEVEKGKAKVVIIDGCASERTVTQFRNMCHDKQVPLILLTESLLERSIGCQGVYTACISHKGFSNQILALWNADNNSQHVKGAERRGAVN